MKTEAQKIFARFGGIDALVRGFEEIGRPLHRLQLEGWLRAKDDCGTGGIIPVHHWPAIQRVAKLKGMRV